MIAERERILNALSELDFDHEMGKVPEDVYPQQRKQLAQAGVDVLRKIDAFQVNGQQEAPDALESVIAERKQELGVAADGDDSLEALIVARRAEQASLHAADKFCPNCGEGIQTDDKFCSHCGAVLT